MELQLYTWLILMSLLSCGGSVKYDDIPDENIYLPDSLRVPCGSNLAGLIRCLEIQRIQHGNERIDKPDSHHGSSHNLDGKQQSSDRTRRAIELLGSKIPKRRGGVDRRRSLPRIRKDKENEYMDSLVSQITEHGSDFLSSTDDQNETETIDEHMSHHSKHKQHSYEGNDRMARSTAPENQHGYYMNEPQSQGYYNPANYNQNNRMTSIDMNASMYNPVGVRNVGFSGGIQPVNPNVQQYDAPPRPVVIPQQPTAVLPYNMIRQTVAPIQAVPIVQPAPHPVVQQVIAPIQQPITAQVQQPAIQQTTKLASPMPRPVVQPQATPSPTTQQQPIPCQDQSSCGTEESSSDSEETTDNPSKIELTCICENDDSTLRKCKCKKGGTKTMEYTSNSEDEMTEVSENYDYESNTDAEIGVVTPSIEYTYGPGMSTKQKKDRLYFGFESKGEGGQQPRKG